MIRQGSMKGIPRLIMDDGHKSAAAIVTIVPTEPWHIGELKKNLRPEDAQEILRFGVSVQHALWYSYKHSLIRKTALIDGVVAAVWGVHGTFLGKTGVVWLLTSPDVKKISPLKFARIYQQEVLEMLTKFQKLENYVDSAYDSATRLLEIIGFELEEPEKIGTGMFRRFKMEVFK